MPALVSDGVSSTCEHFDFDNVLKVGKKRKLKKAPFWFGAVKDASDFAGGC